MAGGPSSPEFVIASCEAGALGSIGAAYSAPQAIEDFYKKVRSKTSGPIAINLFLPQGEPEISEAKLSNAIQATKKYRQELGLPTPTLKPPYEENFDLQFETVLKLKPEVFSFVFGLLKPEYVQAARKEKILTFGAATTFDEALALQDSGVDAITLQGFEGGGHRAIFNSEVSDPNVSMLNLLDQCHVKIKIPLIAAGGIMTSQDIKVAIAHGASAVQMGTAFLACKEAGTSNPYRRALSAPVRSTKLTRAFSGRLARGIENRFMLEMNQHIDAILPFQSQNKFTRDIRNASAQKDSSEFLSLWAGTGEGDLWTGKTADLIHQLFS